LAPTRALDAQDFIQRRNTEISACGGDHLGFQRPVADQLSYARLYRVEAPEDQDRPFDARGFAARHRYELAENRIKARQQIGENVVGGARSPVMNIKRCAGAADQNGVRQNPLQPASADKTSSQGGSCLSVIAISTARENIPKR